MGVYGEFEYGAGVVYGSFFPFITPDSGPVTGGTEVTITGGAYLDTSCDDAFDDTVINPGLWSVSATGTASLAAESEGHLHLQADPGAGSSVAVTGLQSVVDTDVEIDFEIVTQLLALPPGGEVEMATLRLRVDANNYIQISRKAGGAAGHRYEAKVVQGGVTLETAQAPTSDLSGSLRLIRNRSMVYMYAGTTEILRRSGFVTTSAFPQIRVDNLAVAYAIRTDFDSFFIHTMVVFGDEPMLDALVPTDDRIFGTTPPGIAVGEVDLSIATCTTRIETGLDFEYVDPTLFRVLAQTSLSQTLGVSISNDPVLRNLVSGRPGFMR